MVLAADPGILNAFELLLRGGLTLDREAFRSLYDTPFEHLIALGVFCLAAISEAVGQSVDLFLHRVPPKRFLLSLFLTAVMLAFTVVLWTATFWAISRFVYGRDYAFYDLLAGVGLGHAPYLFGFLILIPWLGLVIRAILQVWTLLAVITSLFVLEMPFRDLLLAALPGWLIVEALYRMTGSPVRWLNNFLQNLIYNRPDRITRETLRELLLRSMQHR
ncbi:MAG TPA: hypothetical protein VE621_11540 [Bryobacteraceae bacterium]|jgi:hypothetical protein|nr:hypothetical protein [Bryobacteraceae bacterium]